MGSPQQPQTVEVWDLERMDCEKQVILKLMGLLCELFILLSNVF